MKRKKYFIVKITTCTLVFTDSLDPHIHILRLGAQISANFRPKLFVAVLSISNNLMRELRNNLIKKLFYRMNEKYIKKKKKKKFQAVFFVLGSSHKSLRQQI